MGCTFSAVTVADIDGVRHIRHTPGSPQIDVNDRNAMLILDRLGLDVEEYGEIDATDLLGRAMVGNVGRDDTAVRAVTDGRWTEGGTMDGYFEARLGELAEIARWALANNSQVGWA